MADTPSVLRQILDGALNAPPVEQLATVLGVAGVWLMTRRNLWAFPVGLVQVALFGWVCWRARLYSETALQVMFFGSLVYGWWHWTRPAESERAPGRLSARDRLRCGAAVLALWLAWGAAMARLGASAPWADAFVFAVSVVSQVLQARKLIENWPGWLVANIVATCVFASRGLVWFAALYALFTLLAAHGWREWSRSAPAASHP